MAGGPRRYHEPEFIDNVGGEQRAGDRDTCVDADIAAALLLEIPNEVNQPAAAMHGQQPEDAASALSEINHE